MTASPALTTPPARARGSLADRVVNYINEQVAAHTLKPGDKLPTETTLMSLLGVSRTVVREAISRLQANAVIEASAALCLSRAVSRWVSRWCPRRR
jgi:GntR family transcriptional repressor for pyruvate dehydrogenase complex